VSTGSATISGWTVDDCPYGPATNCTLSGVGLKAVFRDEHLH
jgi:hypothetical protein